MSRGLRRVFIALCTAVVVACTGELEEPPNPRRDAGTQTALVQRDAAAGGGPVIADADTRPPDAGGGVSDAGRVTQPREPDRDGGDEEDASVMPATGGAGTGGRAGRGGGGSGGAAGSSAPPEPTCDGVAPAPGHRAFAAIERLATTRDEVRVLVYGQSISEQAWWTKTRDWLRATYPDGQLVMEEHALGGCSSQCLIGHEPYYPDRSQYNRLPEDVFAWKPDLIIFHVYGDHVDYGYIMRGFAEGCAAFDDYRSEMGEDVPEVHCTDEQRALADGYVKPEVLVQGDFLIAARERVCEKPPTKQDWDCYMNELVIPEQVDTFGYAYQDNFHEFPRYIAAHDLDPSSLLMSDDTHLSEPDGTDVMYALTIPHLCYVPADP